MNLSIISSRIAILYRLKRYLFTNYVSPINWMISLGNWIRVWKQQFRCQAICYLYLVCDHLLTCLNVWHGENEIIETDKIWITSTSHISMRFKNLHHPNIWVWVLVNVLNNFSLPSYKTIMIKNHWPFYFHKAKDVESCRNIFHFSIISLIPLSWIHAKSMVLFVP